MTPLSLTPPDDNLLDNQLGDDLPRGQSFRSQGQINRKAKCRVIGMYHQENQGNDNLDNLELEIDDDTLEDMINITYSQRSKSDFHDDRPRRLSRTEGLGVGGVKIKFNFKKVVRSKKERAKRSMIDVMSNPGSDHNTSHEGRPQFQIHERTAHSTVHGGPNHMNMDQSRDLDGDNNLDSNI